jgi:hypothetical protein
MYSFAPKNISLLSFILLTTIQSNETAAAGVIQDLLIDEMDSDLIHVFCSIPAIPIAREAVSESETLLRLSFHDIAEKFSNLVSTKYEYWLDHAPLMTKSLTTAAVSVVGDVLAQCNEGGNSHAWFTVLNSRRLLGVFADGLLVSGPLMHTVYHELERRWPTADTYWAPIFHVLVDELILDAISVITFFVFSGLFSGKKLPQVCTTLNLQCLHVVEQFE